MEDVASDYFKRQISNLIKSWAGGTKHALAASGHAVVAAEDTGDPRRSRELSTVFHEDGFCSWE
jgi:hypothetical protein